MGWALLLLLTSVAGADALALGLRARVSGRAELAVVSTVVFVALLGAPVLVLGYANYLTATNVALTAAALFGALFAVLARGRPLRAHLAECRAAAASLLRAPFEALAEASRARSPVFVALLVTETLLAYALFLTYRIPMGDWDASIYHEPMIGFSIQNHGFQTVHLPPNLGVQAINGYPRLCEAVGTWFVIFTDRTLVELPNLLAGPALMACTYALARRFADRVTSMGWATVGLLMPQTWAQLCQGCIDVEVGFFALAAILLATRPSYRARDALLATLAMALFLTSKMSALPLAVPIALVAYGRLLTARPRPRRGAIAAIAVGGSSVLAGIGSIPLVRNWREFDNPLWPVDYKLFGVHWHGLESLRDIVSARPLPELIRDAYAPPVGGFDDVILRGYGYAIAWVVIPLGVVAVLCVAVRLALALQPGRGLRGLDPKVANLAWILACVVADILLTPTLNGKNARYNIHMVAGWIVACAWLLSGSRWSRIRDGAITSATLLSVIPLFWVGARTWTWGATDEPLGVLRDPLGPRSYVEKPKFDLLAKERTASLHAGDRVAFDQDVIFVGTLWNFDFSNEVRHIPFETPATFSAALDAYDPTWVAVGNEDARKALEKSATWERVGQLTAPGGTVFRRRARRAR